MPQGCVALDRPPGTPAGNHAPAVLARIPIRFAAAMGDTYAIQSDRLLIRPFAAQDEAGFRAMVGDPEMMRHISGGQPWSEERIGEFFARQGRHLASRGFCLGALIERASGRLAGLSGLQPMGKTEEVEVGWWVMKGFQGRGLATEAGTAALRYAWDALDLPRVKAMAAPGNGPSLRVMEKLGMTFERLATGRELGLVVPDIEVVIYTIDRPRAAR
jgi:RimJ/RimL family protein N-acetyltransferase